MPLKEGSGKAAFKYNVRELVRSGKKIKVALAVAYKKQREAGDGK